MPRYDLPCAARSIARFALAGLLAMLAVLLTDAASRCHWTLALVPFCTGIYGVLMVTDPERI